MSLTVIVPRSQRFAARIVAPLPRRPAVDVVVPVRNRESDLAGRVPALHSVLCDRFPFSARITIADNASTDGTAGVAEALAAALPDVRVLHLNDKGRGRALAAAWMTSDARVVAHMDVDASSDASALLPLVAPILSGHSELAVEKRSSYALVRSLKAIRSDVARRLVPQVIDRGRFFETELLIRAQRAGLRIHEAS
jgi:glycosyltransferase involved in cell wall biosynthesis